MRFLYWPGGLKFTASQKAACSSVTTDLHTSELHEILDHQGVVAFFRDEYGFQLYQVHSIDRQAEHSQNPEKLCVCTRSKSGLPLT